MRRMRDVDFELLQWCRDDRCPDDFLHLAHGRRGNVIRVAAASANAAACAVSVADAVAANEAEADTGDDADADAQPHVGTTVIECAYAHVPLRSPRMFKHIYYDVVNDFGSVAERTLYRAMRTLVTDRRIACIADPSVSWATYRRNPSTTSGFYIRYDSPLLWTPGGLASVYEAIGDYAKPMDYT
ncbi:hypothetical protein [Tessaracoccus sp.]|uniref:hypothetical protein n=1 Tax=Tessaracoccus sp. TaxID=1971211 RepID=UPI0026262183|nr:hypothetical protein [Tessaracoccus sp.]